MKIREKIILLGLALSTPVHAQLNYTSASRVIRYSGEYLTFGPVNVGGIIINDFFMQPVSWDVSNNLTFGGFDAAESSTDTGASNRQESLIPSPRP